MDTLLFTTSNKVAFFAGTTFANLFLFISSASVVLHAPSIILQSAAKRLIDSTWWSSYLLLLTGTTSKSSFLSMLNSFLTCLTFASLSNINFLTTLVFALLLPTLIRYSPGSIIKAACFSSKDVRLSVANFRVTI